ncbi:hypothetical protein Ddc_21275 [Ditylenchus destructor]|nr:hypothetical protein Ddc_21275 [Ditylenchus destructor]
MSNSKPLPSFIFDSLYYLNRDQLERFSIACRPLKNFIERYLHSKPYRVFDRLWIRGGSYALFHNDVQWHPNREDYSVQQFLAGQKYIDDEYGGAQEGYIFYPFPEMRPYLATNVRVKDTHIYVGKESIYNPEHIEEMESMTYRWRDGNLGIFNIAKNYFSQIQNFGQRKILPNYWLEFLEKPGVKPVVVFHYVYRENIDNLLDNISKTFSTAVMPNAFKIVFVQFFSNEPLTEFQETNKISGEKLELKKGFPVEYQDERFIEYHTYTLERSSI